ncbi:MAG: CBS domain-containing protein [Bifidobacteriaceae bacterium]|jgi:flagellar motility protein MotE (MotC chaperone)|nr:CBS domain-containing protein [Bifidobacteriaceae bacterium]
MSPSRRIFVARLAGTAVFDPIGDRVGWARDVVVNIGLRGRPRAIGLVVEVPGKRRVFLPFTRVTSIDSGQIVSTGLVNMRRFEQRAVETLVVGELLDRRIVLKNDRHALIEDVAIEANPVLRGEWEITQLFVRVLEGSRGIGRLRGPTELVDVREVPDLAGQAGVQGVGQLMASWGDMKPADMADLLHDMPQARRLEVAAALDNDRLADVLQELGNDDRLEIIEHLGRARAADVLEAMEPDDAADLINELPDNEASILLALMEPGEAQDVRRLLAYGENSAGGLMTTEPVIMPPESPIAQALAAVRRHDLSPALASMVFVTRPPSETPTGRFLGVVHIQRLLREPPHQAIGTVLDTDVEPLAPDDPLGRVTRLMATYNLIALPVVDSDRRLLGAVSADDVLDHLLPEDWRSGDDDVTDQSLGPAEEVAHA